MSVCDLALCTIKTMTHNRFPVFPGTANNAGAILVLGRDLVVVPKLIHPIPPPIASAESSPEHHLEDTWMQVTGCLRVVSIFQLI